MSQASPSRAKSGHADKSTSAQAALAHLTLGEYLDSLAGREHAPGGGAAVALTGAQGAALLSMVHLISAGKDEPHPELQSHLDEVRRRLTTLAAEDGAAFGRVMAAYKLPTSNDDEKAIRTAAVQSALKQAALVPLEVMSAIDELFDDAGEVIARSKPSVVSDAAIAVRLLYAALKAGTANVEINLKFITDKDFKKQTEEQVRELLEDKKDAKRQLLKEAEKKMQQ